VAARARTLAGCRPLFLVATTARGSLEDRAATALAGFHFHLVKPIDTEMLRATLDRCRAVTRAPAANAPPTVPVSRATPQRQGEYMDTHSPLNDDTPDPSTVRTIPDLRLADTPSDDGERADLRAAKGAASLLTEQGLLELKAWIEMKIGRRAGF
jgi:hypothetical protein